MLAHLKSKLCCKSTTSSVNLSMQLLRSKDPSMSQKGSPKIEHGYNGYIASNPTPLDLSNNYLYITLDFNCGSIRPDQDFLYLEKEELVIKSNIKKLDPAFMVEIRRNRHDPSSGECHVSLQSIDLSKVYKIYYYRKDPKTKKAQSLHETKRFKIALKNKIYNLFADSVQNLAGQEFAIFYEDDPFFEKIKPRKSQRSYHKNASMAPASDITSTSTKTTSSSKNSTSEDQMFPRANSIFTTTSSPKEELNSNPSSGSGGLYKDSFQEHFPRYEKPVRNASVGHLFDTRRCLFNENLRAGHREIYESFLNQEIYGNESVIVNENKENDEYIRKLCAAFSDNSLYALHDRASILSPSTLKEASSPNGLIFPPANNKTQIYCHTEPTEVMSRKYSGDRQLCSTTSAIVGQRLEKGSYNDRNLGNRRSSLIYEKGSFVVESEQYGNLPRNYEENINFSIMKRRQSQDFSSRGFEQLNDSKFLISQLLKENRAEGPKPTQKLIDFSDQKHKANIDRAQGSSSEESLIILETTLEEDQGEVVFNEVPAQDNEEEEDSESKIVFTTESDQKEIPQYVEVEPPVRYTPRYSDRLYTVEEVCSASKESSNGWELQVKMFNSECATNRNITNSTRWRDEKCTTSNQKEPYEGTNLDFENLSAPVTQNSVKEMPLEVMILKQKVENFGMRLEYFQKECLVCIQDRARKDQRYFFKWYEETTDKDLYQYFDGIIETIKHLVFQGN